MTHPHGQRLLSHLTARSIELAPRRGAGRSDRPRYAPTCDGTAGGEGTRPRRTAPGLFSGLDLVVAPGDGDRARRPERRRQVHGPAVCSPGWARPPRAHAPCHRRAPTSACCRRRPSGSRARRCSSTWPDAPAWPRPSRRSTAPRSALAAGEDGADERYGDALERWLALGRTRHGRAGRGRGRRGRPRTSALDRTDDLAVRRPGRTGGLAALLLSRFDVLLLDEPTNDLDLVGLEQLERFVSGTAGRRRARQPRPGVPGRTVDQGARARPAPALGPPVRRRLRRRTWSSEARSAPARPGARFEEYADTLSSLKERGRTQRTWADKGARAARRNPADNDKFVKNWAVSSSGEAGVQGTPDRPHDRAPRDGRGAAQGVAAAAVDRRAPPSGRVVAVAARRRRCGGARSTLGPVTLQIDRGDRVGDHRPERIRQVDAARAAARAAATRWRRRVARRRRVRSARSTRPAPRSSATTAAGRVLRRGAGAGRVRGAHAACQVRARAATTSPRAATPCRPANAPEPGSRCCRPAGSTCSSSTSRPTTSTSRRSSSSESALELVRRHAAAGHPRPASAGRGAGDTSVRGRRGPRERDLTGTGVAAAHRVRTARRAIDRRVPRHYRGPLSTIAGGSSS